MKVYSLALFVICLFLISCGGGSNKSSSSSTIDDNIPDESTESLALVISPVEAKTIGSSIYNSSTKADVSWTNPSYSVDHYELHVLDSITNASTILVVDGGLDSTTLSDLKAGTTYMIELFALKNTTGSVTSDITKISSFTTSEEYWQIQGSGNDYASATKIYDESSTASCTIHYGSEAGSSLNGKIRLYCNHSPIKFLNDLGIVVDTGLMPSTSNVVVNSSADDFTSFSPDIEYGLRNPMTSGTLIDRIMTYQPLPISSSGEKIRMYFEAKDKSDVTRLFYVDSVDGYIGLDFNPSSSSTLLQDGTDWDALATVAVGVETDTTNGHTGLSQVRQTKIGFPILDSWIWDDTKTSFMVMTGADVSGTITNGLFFATGSGKTWSVKKDTNEIDAKPLVKIAHGPVLVHLGGLKYKLYYEDEGAGTSNKKHKPLKSIYVDGAFAGDASVIEFEDWESEDSSRDIHFLWPDGSDMSSDDESGLGDHYIFMPDNDTNSQVMYMNLGGFDHEASPSASKGVGIAVLVNP